MTNAVSGHRVVVTVGETSTQVAIFDDNAALLATREDSRLGAQTVDAALRRWGQSQLGQRNPEFPDAMANVPVAALRSALAQLEFQPSAPIPVGDDRLTLTVTIAETLLAPEINQLSQLVHTAVDAAGPGPISGIYPFGELTRIPPALRALGRFGPLRVADRPQQAALPPPSRPTTTRRKGAIGLGVGTVAIAIVVAVAVVLSQSHTTSRNQPGYDTSTPHCQRLSGAITGPHIIIPDRGESLAADPGAHRLLVVGDNGVTVVDTTTNTVKSTLRLPNGEGVAVDTTLHRAYVTSKRSSSDSDSSRDDLLTILDTTTGTITGQTHAGNADMFADESVTVDESTHLVYVSGAEALAQFDPAANAVTYHSLNPGSVDSVAADSTTHHIYAIQNNSRSLVLFDPSPDAAYEGITTLPIDRKSDRGIYYVATDPVLHRAYVDGGDSVLTVDTTSGTVIASAQTEWGAGVAVDRDTHAVYVTNTVDCSVWKLGPAGTTVVPVAPIGGDDRTTDLAIDPEDKILYALNGKAVNIIHL